MVEERWRIRRAGASDAAAIATVHIQSWVDAYSSILPPEEFEKRTLTERIRHWTEWLGDEDFVVSVAETKGSPVGFVSVRSASEPDVGDDRMAGEVAALYLLKGAWGSGLGRKLLAVGTDCLARRGFDSAVLWVLRDNDRARRFYEANGWSFDGGTKDCFGGANAPAVRYGRSLSGSAPHE